MPKIWCERDGNGMGEVPGHPPELSDSVKLLLTHAKRHVLEIKEYTSIYFVLKFYAFWSSSLFFCGFEVKALVSPPSRFSIKIQESSW